MAEAKMYLLDSDVVIWHLRRHPGVTLVLVDATIAATAEIHSLVLVTMNASHYPMPGLTVLPVSPGR